MFVKRGLIYLVIFLVLIISVNSQSTFQCEDGTMLGSCKQGTNLFCGGSENLIFNSGFENDNDNNGIPDSYVLDPNAVLNINLFYSDDAYRGEKSIKITKQWASFDYKASIIPAIVLRPNTEYFFFSFVKGSCNNLRVFYSQEQTGQAHELCGANSACTLIPVENGWSRLITQFSSNQITTTVASGGASVPFLLYPRIECADSTPFELYVDSMYLQPVETPVISENCQICGGCEGGERVNEDELILRCIEEKDCSICEGLSDSNPFKQVALEQCAILNDESDLCETNLCAQKVAYFNCPYTSTKTECVIQGLRDSGVPLNPNFLNGGDIYLRQNDIGGIKKFKLGGGDNKLEGECEIHYRKDARSGSVYINEYFGINFGTIISHMPGNNIYSYLSTPFENEIASLSSSSHEALRNRARHLTEIREELSRVFPWESRYLGDLSKYGSRDYNLLDTAKGIRPKADILCGYDKKLYLCNREGIKTFDNGRSYYCNNNIWTPIDEEPQPIVVGKVVASPSRESSTEVQPARDYYSIAIENAQLTSPEIKLLNQNTLISGGCYVDVKEETRPKGNMGISPSTIWNKDSTLRDLGVDFRYFATYFGTLTEDQALNIRNTYGDLQCVQEGEFGGWVIIN
ncbi:MAG: hypothetical protein KKG75_03825 [Nanoarchaeota archaeon]|nr:hypothetical protein [Nanoarchaeota archaeon]